MRYTQPLPNGFNIHEFQRTFRLPYSRETVWDTLLQQSTFTQTQLWPFRVEFEKQSKYMQPGMDNVHHGPFILFSGVVTEVRPSVYRDLHYYTGSYFGSIRMIRPARLEFTLEGDGDETLVHLKLTSYIKPWVRWIWKNMLAIFWSGFGGWISRYIGKQSQ